MKKKIMLLITLILSCLLFSSCKKEEYVILQESCNFGYIFDIFIPKYVEKNGSKADIPIDAVLGKDWSTLYRNLFLNGGEVELEIVVFTETKEEKLLFDKFPYLEWRGREHKKFNLPLTSNHGWIEIEYRVHETKPESNLYQFFLVKFKTIEKKKNLYYEFSLEVQPGCVL